MAQDTECLHCTHTSYTTIATLRVEAANQNNYKEMDDSLKPQLESIFCPTVQEFLLHWCSCYDRREWLWTRWQLRLQNTIPFSLDWPTQPGPALISHDINLDKLMLSCYSSDEYKQLFVSFVLCQDSTWLLYEG